MDLKSKLRNSPLTGALYRKLYSVKWNVEEKNRRERLSKSGVEVLAQVIADLRDGPWRGFAAYGTLLGLVRSGGLIEHDNDIDFGILTEDPDLFDVACWFADRGYTLSRGFLLNDKLAEISLSLQGLDIDLFSFGETPYGYGSPSFFNDPKHPMPEATLKVALTAVSPIEGIETLSAMDLEIPVPEASELFLIECYGESWRIPDPQWEDSASPSWKELNDAVGFYLDSQALQSYLVKRKKHNGHASS